MEYYGVRCWKNETKVCFQILIKHKWESFVWKIPISLWVFFLKVSGYGYKLAYLSTFADDVPYSFRKAFYGFVSRMFICRNSLLFLTKSTCFNLLNEVSWANPLFHHGEFLVGISFFKNCACGFILSSDFLKLLLSTQPLYQRCFYVTLVTFHLCLFLASQLRLQREMDLTMSIIFCYRFNFLESNVIFNKDA